MQRIRWPEQSNVSVSQFVCGYCGKDVASEKGWTGRLFASDAILATIFICPNCTKPTFFSNFGDHMPAASMGALVGDISETSVEQLYSEARRATAASCYTAAVLCCRKLLMHIAVAKGAPVGGNF